MYTGLDRFGRVIDQIYMNASGTITDRIQYAYDRDGDVVSEDNLAGDSTNSSEDQTFTFDNLGRIVSNTRGGAVYQSWDLDAQDNAASVTTGGVTQTQGTNALNQIDNDAYDANGNMTTDTSQGQTMVYDAWNRLVAVENTEGATLITTYAYDGLGRRISETPASGGGTASNLYYSSNWQVIEERQGTTTYQYVWSPTYVDDMILRTSYIPSVGTQQLYAQHDINYNVTSIVNSSGTVVQRYLYSVYGEVTVLNPDFSAVSSQTTVDGWSYLFQDSRLDSQTGLYEKRRRVYKPDEGFLQPDPSGYTDGDSLYAAYFAMGGAVDPTGLSWSSIWNSVSANASGAVGAVFGFGQGAVQGVENIGIGVGNTVVQMGLQTADGLNDISAIVGAPSYQGNLSQLGQAAESDSFNATQYTVQTGANLATFGVSGELQTLYQYGTGQIDENTASQQLGAAGVMQLLTAGAMKASLPGNVAPSDEAVVPSSPPVDNTVIGNPPSPIDADMGAYDPLDGNTPQAPATPDVSNPDAPEINNAVGGGYPEEQPGPSQPYNRASQYGKTPTAGDRAALGAQLGQVVDHQPPLCQRWYEGDPETGEPPGYQMTEAQRKASAADRSRMQLQSQNDSNSQGGQMSRYSRIQKQRYGLTK